MLLVLCDILEEARETVRRGAEGRARSHLQLTCVDEVHHAVLNDLGVDRELRDIGIDETAHDGIGHVAHAALQRQQMLGQAARQLLTMEEVERELAHALR